MISQEETNRASTVPRAVIHKRILDVAKSHPTMSIGEIATVVTGASETLVERVLDEYGDPAEDAETESGPATDAPATPEPADAAVDDGSSTNETMTDATTSEASARRAHDGEHGSASITEPQREILRAVLDRPDASQRDLAADFDVSVSTINTRLNSIDGFYWERRQEFAESMLENGSSPRGDDDSSPAGRDDPTDGVAGAIEELSDEVAALSTRVAAIEDGLEERAAGTGSPFGGPDLTARVVRACVRADDISEEEELQILTAALAHSES